MNFDERLRMTKTPAQYHLDKVKGGRCGSSAGRPRPYSKQNMLIARLYSPKLVGQSVTVTPKEPWLIFHPGHYYEWKVIAEGEGTMDGMSISADDIKEHFIVRKKVNGQ